MIKSTTIREDNENSTQVVGSRDLSAQDWRDRSYPTNEIQIERIVEVV